MEERISEGSGTRLGSEGLRSSAMCLWKGEKEGVRP